MEVIKINVFCHLLNNSGFLIKGKLVRAKSAVADSTIK
jgi:hypothetical protein